MQKNLGARPNTYPQPVFIVASYGEDGTPDAINAAWGGISEASEISMCYDCRAAFGGADCGRYVHGTAPISGESVMVSFVISFGKKRGQYAIVNSWLPRM